MCVCVHTHIAENIAQVPFITIGNAFRKYLHVEVFPNEAFPLTFDPGDETQDLVHNKHRLYLCSTSPAPLCRKYLECYRFGIT